MNDSANSDPAIDQQAAGHDPLRADALDQPGRQRCG